RCPGRQGTLSPCYTASPLNGDGISIDVEYIPSGRLGVSVRVLLGGAMLLMRAKSDAPLLHIPYFSTTPRATSRGSTFPPPAICGCDGSKPSRNSRLSTSERAIRKASFRLSARRSAVLKKASPK